MSNVWPAAATATKRVFMVSTSCHAPAVRGRIYPGRSVAPHA